MTTKKIRGIPEILWDFWCIGTVIGIWPRFIEPNLLWNTHLDLPVANLPQELDGLKILQFSDLHLNPRAPKKLFSRLQKKARNLKPDIIVFTGDFLCNATLFEKSDLISYLQGFEAPLGCYAILGNHDYSKMVTINEDGDYDIERLSNSLILKGLKRIFRPPPLTKKLTEDGKKLIPHEELIQLIKATPFQLLNNASVQIQKGDATLNLVGLGEHMIGKCLPDLAFQNYKKHAPGIVLVHNPDAIPHLTSYPGELILCGHTHGDQINLPWFRTRFNVMEQPQYRRGLHSIGEKMAYINRGIGGCLNFRWFAPPELTCVTLKKRES